jgi:hypothetical protein
MEEFVHQRGAAPPVPQDKDRWASQGCTPDSPAMDEMLGGSQEIVERGKKADPEGPMEP